MSEVKVLVPLPPLSQEVWYEMKRLSILQTKNDDCCVGGETDGPAHRLRVGRFPCCFDVITLFR